MQNVQDEKTHPMLKLLQGLDEMEVGRKYAMFIRHADRDKIPEGEFGNEVELNEKGILRSIELGKLLRHHRINRIYTSPISRCVQTGLSISTGTGRIIAMESSNLLGDPGAFVYDGDMAGFQYMQLGFEKCYDHLLNDIPVDGNYPIKTGASTLTDFIRNTTKEPGINIYVSHDMIVALYAYAVFRKKFEPGANWVKYLEGLIFQIC